MPQVKEYSSRDQIVSVGPVGALLPLVDLADADDAILASMYEAKFGKPMKDLYGKVARHVKNNDDSGTVTLRIKSTSVSDLGYLSGLEAAGAAVSVTGKDLSTKIASFVGLDCRIERAPDYQRGKNAVDIVFLLVCGKLKITHDGPRPAVV